MRRLKGIDFQGKKLIIKRIIPEHKLKPNFNHELLKQWPMSDIILKKGNVFYCCEIIEEAQIIEQSEIQ